MKSSMRTPWSLQRVVVALSALTAAACVGATGCSSDAEPSASAPPSPGETVFTHVHYKDEADLQRLTKKYDVLEEVNGEEGWVSVLIDDPAQYEALVASGHRVDIVEREMQRERLRLQSNTDATGIPGYSCYRTVEETHAALQRLASDYPGLAKVVNIGPTWNKENRGAGYDMLVLKLTNGAISGPKPAFFLMGGIHAREYTTSETVLRFAEQMAKGHGTDPDATWLLDHYELHVLAQTNPDGRKVAEQGYYQRKNANDTNGGSCSDPPTSSNQYGTDLNRNSSSQFNTGGSSDGQCDQDYHGPTAASEPETDNVQKYVASIFPDQRGPNLGDAAPSDASGVLITLHSYAQKVLYPWGFRSSAPPNGAQLATLGRKFGFLNGYTACQVAAPGCMYVASGGTDDWSYGELGVASFTIEMGTAFFEKCSTYEQSVAPGNLSALRYAFKAARRPYQTPAGPEALQVTASPASVSAGTSVTLTATADDTRYKGSEPTQNIAAARYTVDTPSWASEATSIAMGAADGAFDAKSEKVTATVDTTGWTRGRHIVFVEGNDAQGNWGVPSAAFIDIE